MCAKSVYDNCRDKLQFISNIASPLALLIRGIDSALFILLLYFIIYFIFNFILERTYGKLFRSQRIHLRDSFWGELIPHLLNVSEQENQFINHTFSDNNSISYWIIKLSVITEKHFEIIREVEKKGYFELISSNKISHSYKKLISIINFGSIYCVFVKEHRLILDVIEKLQQIYDSISDPTIEVIICQYNSINKDYSSIISRLKSINNFTCNIKL